MLLNCGVGEDSWESLGLQGDQTISPKGNQSWIFIGGTDAEAPVLWPSAAKSWFIRKDPDAGKDWRQEKNGVTEDKMVRYHHRFNRHESEQALGVGEGQGSLSCCRLWDCRVRHNWATEQQQLRGMWKKGTAVQTSFQIMKLTMRSGGCLRLKPGLLAMEAARD